MASDPTAELMFELTRILSLGDVDTARARTLVASLDPAWAEDFDRVLDLLFLGSEPHWLRLLHRTQGVSLLCNGKPIELYPRLKRLSPFARVELIFEPFGAHLNTAQRLAHATGFSLEHDEFALVHQRVSGREVYMRLAWIRPRPGSPGAPERDSPLRPVNLTI